MNDQTGRLGALFIIIAGFFWATMGLFVRFFSALGFDSFQTAAFRLSVAAIGFCLLLFIRDRRGFRIRPKDIPLFMGLGLGSIAVMTCCYFTAIRLLTMSAAAILLYTSPIWVMLMSVLFLHERITGRKITALILAFGGCVLVSGLGSGGINAAGIAVGIASGIAYGLYSILGNIALRRYSSYTVTTYTFLFAALGVLAFARPAEMVQKVAAAQNPAFLVLLVPAFGIVTAVIPYLLYTLGLESVEPSRAAILATTEPMMATVLGILVYREGMNPSSILGILCILIAIFILNRKQNSGS